MKKLLYVALLPLALFSIASCGKDDDKTVTPVTPVTPDTPAVTRRWTKVYKNVVIADDRYPAQGQFLNSKTGTTVKVANAVDSIRERLALVCYISESGNYVYLTAPGSLAGALGSTPNRTVFTQNPNGLNNWTPAELNTSLIRPVAGGMTASDFDNLANTPTWTAFNNAYKSNNNGNENLAFVLSYEFAQSGDIFLVQINGALRMIVKATSVSDATTNGYIKADIIVEGRGDMASAGLPLMPAE